MQKQTNEGRIHFTRISPFRGQQYVAVFLRRKIKSFAGNVTRYDQPRISGTVRLAVSITFALSPFLSLSLPIYLSISFSFFPSRSFLAATAAPSPRFTYLAAFTRPVANNPSEESLTSSSAGCNKKKPPTASSATRYTPMRCAYTCECPCTGAHARVCMYVNIAKIAAVVGGTTLRTSNEIKFKYNQIKFKI